MDGKTQRADYRRIIGKAKGKSRENRIADKADTQEHAVLLPSQIPPLLVDATRGAKILGVSVSHFYVFMRRNAAVQPITISSTNMWRRKDILRFTSKADEPPITEDILVDAQELAALCSISLSMVYKLKRLNLMPAPFRDGRTSNGVFRKSGNG